MASDSTLARLFFDTPVSKFTLVDWAEVGRSLGEVGTLADLCEMVARAGAMPTPPPTQPGPAAIRPQSLRASATAARRGNVDAPAVAVASSLPGSSPSPTPAQKASAPGTTGVRASLPISTAVRRQRMRAATENERKNGGRRTTTAFPPGRGIRYRPQIKTYRIIPLTLEEEVAGIPGYGLVDRGRRLPDDVEAVLVRPGLSDPGASAPLRQMISDLVFYQQSNPQETALYIDRQFGPAVERILHVSGYSLEQPPRRYYTIGRVEPTGVRTVTVYGADPTATEEDAALLRGLRQAGAEVTAVADGGGYELQLPRDPVLYRQVTDDLARMGFPLF